ncbi:MAG TPA: PAS domain S-box protein [Opitutus sp.]|nr:PAS domain S-box protein [Opitutus sp.]
MSSSSRRATGAKPKTSSRAKATAAGRAPGRKTPAPAGRTGAGGAALKAQVEDLERLHEVTMKVARMTDCGAAVTGVLQAVLAAVGAAKGLLSLRDEGGALRVATAVGFPRKFLESHDASAPGAGPWGAALTRGERVVVTNVREHPRFAGLDELARLGGFGACHSVPLRTHGGEVIGVLTAHFAAPHQPDTREERLMDVYACMAADLIARDGVAGRLRESEERFRTLANHAPVGIFLSDAHGETIFVNGCWSEMAGMSQETARGGGWLRAVHPEDRRRITAEWDGAVKGRANSESQFRFRRPDGKITWVHGRAVRLRDRAGKPAGYLGTVADVSADRRAESEIRASEGRYRELMERLPVAVYTTDAEGRVKLFNAAAVELWGRAPAPADRWCGSARMHTLDGAPLALDKCPMAIALRERRAIGGVEAIVERPDGEWRHVLVNPHPLFDEDGRLAGGVNVLLDITERRRAEDARARLGAIVEWSEDAIVSKNLDGIILSWNRGAERLFGYTAEEVVGRPITLLIPPNRLEEETSILNRIRRGERLQHFETVRRHKDGRLVDISLAVSPVRDRNGSIVGASKIARDISAQKESEREIERARDRAVAAARAKDDFLAALSHELRTPLNPVLLLASEAAGDPELPERVRENFATIRKNVELEARLIDDLLDLTRITRGKLALNFSLQDLHAILQDALAMLRTDFDQKQLTVSFDLRARTPIVRGDAVRLQQVLWNVLNNAVKFTPEGGAVTVRTREAGTRVAVEVSDTGIGMTAAEITRAFDAFSQGDHAQDGRPHRFGGIGLGLAISRMLVEQHGGSIRVTSAGREQGATIEIELPRAAGADGGGALERGTIAGPAATGQPKPAVRGRILLVEDHKPTRTALAQLLRQRRYGVATAGTVGEARQLAAAGGIDLVISDVGLPDGNGYELMKELRAHHQLKGIALSGYGTDQDLAHSHAAGFEMHLTKPITMQALDRALAEVAKDSGGG